MVPNIVTGGATDVGERYGRCAVAWPRPAPIRSLADGGFVALDPLAAATDLEAFEAFAAKGDVAPARIAERVSPPPVAAGDRLR